MTEFKKISISFIVSVLLGFFIIPLIRPNVSLANATSPWSTSTITLPYSLASHASEVSYNKLLIIGGANTDDYSQVYSIRLNNGTLSDLTEETSATLPEARYWGSTVQKENRIYYIGGASSGGAGFYMENVYSTAVNSQGNISSWNSLAPLPEKWALGSAAIVGNYIYYAGGFRGVDTISNKIYYAQINPDGSIGNWTTSSITLPEPRFGFTMVSYNNNLIIVGGLSSNNIFPTTVYRTTINTTDGSLSSWQTTTPLSAGAYRSETIRVNKRLFVIGGGDGNNSLNSNSVRYADINSDGTLSAWKTSANFLPQSVSAGAVAYNNGYLYVTGGYNENNNQPNYLNTVYYAKLDTSNSLPVPLIKQTDPKWANLEYDSASLWSKEKTTIARWGCVITSAVMVFNYYGITKLPDGTPLTPATLNAWLKARPKGYIGDGLVNWGALTALSKLSKSQNPSFLYDMLEYQKKGANSFSQLTQDLGAGQPDILEEPGHFVVATGTQDATFTINDPLYPRTLLSDYSNTFKSLRRFIPSNSDGSYIELFVNSAVDIIVKDKNGNVVGESYTEQPLQDDIGGGTSGQPIKVYLVPKPANGEYFVTVSSSSTQKYTLQSDIYNQNAQNTTGDFSGTVSAGKPDTYIIAFDRQDIQKENIGRQVTFDTLLADIQEVKDLKYLFNNGIYTGLKGYATSAKKYFEQGKTKLSKSALQNLLKLLNSLEGKGIQEDGYQLLFYDVGYLLGRL